MSKDLIHLQGFGLVWALKQGFSRKVDGGQKDFRSLRLLTLSVSHNEFG